MGDAQEVVFGPVWPHGLHPDGQAVAIIADGEGDGGEAEQVAGEGVAHQFGGGVEVGPAAVVAAGGNGRGGEGGGGGDDGVYLLEEFAEDVQAAGADALCLEIVVGGGGFAEEEVDAGGEAAGLPAFGVGFHVGGDFDEDGDGVGDAHFVEVGDFNLLEGGPGGLELFGRLPVGGDDFGVGVVEPVGEDAEGEAV